MEAASIPVITKLTPNVHSVVPTGRAAVEAGSQGLSLINTIQSVTGVDLDTFIPNPNVGGKSTFGGYCGPAVKPIALKMLTTIAQDPVTGKVPVSGIGGVSDWRDAAEFMLLGSTSVQVCTAVMKYGFRIIEDLCEGLSRWMDEKGFARTTDFIGRSVPTLIPWEDLDLNYHIGAVSIPPNVYTAGFAISPARTLRTSRLRLRRVTRIIPIRSRNPNVSVAIFVNSSAPWTGV
jgi:dihydropyrimidine dehydrogenase (NAD+) subunit PreA